MHVSALVQNKSLPFGQQVRPHRLHPKVQAQLVVKKVIHIFREKSLVQPERPLDLHRHAQFLPHFPHHGLLRRFPHLHSASWQVIVRGALILHS